MDVMNFSDACAQFKGVMDRAIHDKQEVVVTRKKGKAVVDMVLDQGPFGLLHGFLHRVKLLRDIHARLGVLDHTDDAGKVTIGAFQPLHDGGVGCMMGWF